MISVYHRLNNTILLSLDIYFELNEELIGFFRCVFEIFSSCRHLSMLLIISAFCIKHNFLGGLAEDDSLINSILTNQLVSNNKVDSRRLCQII